MSAPEAPLRRLLFVADAAVAEVHDLPPEARALLSAAAEVYVVTPTLHLADERLDAVLGTCGRFAPTPAERTTAAAS